ncbi:Isochorismatase hydrolase [Aspergillus ellipticus CBS 707.79]|uniref:Isochorismatase hydrolase n=1 Tax=Aspergillus ellipticus CBS 707.79 TaxID=1448320 RepID=A0A319D0M5_9EURO|nr:Isochorismatase hydrolase [Aspergillus ellipticus CBS 707.79]
MNCPTRSNPHYEPNLQSLLTAFRTAKATHTHSNPNSALEIIHVFHASTSHASPLHPAHPSHGTQPFAFAQPAADGSEPVPWKSVNSSFIGTELERYLRARDIRQLVVAGLTTDHCVSTTVRMAANLGVVDRRTGGFDAETVHAVSVASLEGESAEVMTTEEVVSALGSLGK